MSWYVTVIKPRSEHIATRELTRSGYQTFNPCYMARKLRRGRLVKVVQRYLPGYLFVDFDVVKDDWTAINHLDGVQRVMCNPIHWPVPVAPAVVAAMRDWADIEPEPLGIQLGNWVRLIDGPFEGQRCVVQRMMKTQCMVMLGERKLYVAQNSIVLVAG